MGLRTYKIELKVDFNDAGRFEAMEAALRQAARTILTTAMMLQDSRDPQILFSSSQFAMSTEQLKIEDAVDAEVQS